MNSNSGHRQSVSSRHWITPAMLLLLLLPFIAHANPDKLRLGWVEYVVLHPANLTLRTKLDSGAKTSSLNCPPADCHKVTKVDGSVWIDLTVTDWRGERHRYTKPVVRVAKIRRHFGASQERHVIKLDICLAGKRKTIEVTLVDRQGFNYQLLLGRKAIKGDFVIDPDATYLADKLSLARCRGVATVPAS